jgi:hypothetical protein
MNALKTASLLLANVIVLLVLPLAAHAQYVVPPDNSAVNQYTETVPTAAGGQDTDRQGKQGRSPSDVLGTGNAKRLEARGPQGRATAEVAAATAPDAGPPRATPAVDMQAGASNKQGGAGDVREAEIPNPPAVSQLSNDPSGSSGLSEVIAQATGSSSSDEMGPLLPIVILAALAWSLSYFWRQRKRIG